MNVYTWFWLLYAILGIVVEFVALFNGRVRDTASETIWHWITKPFDSKPANVAVWIGRIGIITFFAWLAVHFGFGWLTT